MSFRVDGIAILRAAVLAMTVIMALWASGCGGGDSGRTANQVEATGAWGDYTGTTLSAYMKLTNHGARADAVTGASAPGIGRAMLHLSQMTGELMRMERVSRIELPPGKTVELKPGGYHVMVEVEDTQRPFERGDRWPLILRLASGGELRIEVEVK